MLCFACSLKQGKRCTLRFTNATSVRGQRVVVVTQALVNVMTACRVSCPAEVTHPASSESVGQQSKYFSRIPNAQHGIATFSKASRWLNRLSVMSHAHVRCRPWTLPSCQCRRTLWATSKLSATRNAFKSDQGQPILGESRSARTVSCARGGGGRFVGFSTTREPYLSGWSPRGAWPKSLKRRVWEGKRGSATK